MITVQLVQGSKEWHGFRAGKFTAADAPAMLGFSKYKTRDQLLAEKSGNAVPEEISPAKQALFDDGHKAEDMQRPLIEEMIGEELFPATGYSSDWEKLAASLDGITMLDDVIYEHKLWNEPLARYIDVEKDLPDTHWPQVEHQLYVSGARLCYFVVSDGTAEKRVILEYVSKPKRQKQIIAGWKQFEKDLDGFVPVQAKAKLEAEPVRDLPALSYQLDRKTLALTSNIELYKAAAEKLVEESKKPLQTDQDFANAESMTKIFKATEDKLAAVCDNVQGEIKDVDAFVKDLKQISENIRQARLATEKQVKNRKEEIKNDILTAARSDLSKRLADIGSEFKSPVHFPSDHFYQTADFAGVIKGKKTVASIQSSVNDELARVQVEASLVADRFRANLAVMDEFAKDYLFLFNDINTLLVNELEPFKAIVQNRVNAHKQAETERLEAIRKQAEDDARAKLEAEAARLAAATEQKPVQDQVSTQVPVAQTDKPAGTTLYSATVGLPMSDGGPAIPASYRDRLNAIVANDVTISAEEYDELKLKAEKFDALMAHGVDNWDGYSDAMDAFAEYA